MACSRLEQAVPGRNGAACKRAAVDDLSMWRAANRSAFSFHKCHSAAYRLGRFWVTGGPSGWSTAGQAERHGRAVLRREATLRGVNGWQSYGS